MQTYDFEGKTTEDAIKKASRELDLPQEELNVDIIEPGSAGIFGLVGGRKAKIKVTIKGNSEEETEKISTIEEPENIFEPEPLKSTEEPNVTEILPENENRNIKDDDEGLELARTSLEKILSLIPVDTTVQARQMNNKIKLDIEGDKSGLLIGRKGKTLDSLQFIVNKIVNKALERRVNIVVDSENYRQRRKESLIQLANKLGDKAKRIRKPVTTNPMNPHDRRIVHIALKEDNRLDTRSRGEGLLKKVVIIPRR